jgi:hypothetical protein
LGSPPGALSICDQRIGRACCHPDLRCEALCPLTDEQDMSARFHHRPREAHRVGDPPHGADGASGQLLTVHDRGVEFYVAVSIQTGPSSRIEDWVIFEQSDRSLHRLRR